MYTYIYIYIYIHVLGSTGFGGCPSARLVGETEQGNRGYMGI